MKKWLQQQIKHTSKFVLYFWLDCYSTTVVRTRYFLARNARRISIFRSSQNVYRTLDILNFLLKKKNVSPVSTTWRGPMTDFITTIFPNGRRTSQRRPQTVFFLLFHFVSIRLENNQFVCDVCDAGWWGWFRTKPFCYHSAPTRRFDFRPNGN